jgi:hypothetical protein
MNTQSVVDQMTSTLARRRQLTRDRRTAYLALARAILSDGPIDQELPIAEYPASLGERHGYAA